MTSEERDYLQAVAQLGCIACRKNGLPGTPAEVHHQRSGTGAGRRASHFDTMPLCPGHHRFYDDAIHCNATLFISRYGSEQALVKQTRDEVALFRQSFIG
ncbi:Ref family recombination enhancement nuclease [Endozoicomonas atrinae]|uniref:Ref family recombination enhancement nuclease n=1 Tax=Endozoicomonas atrinae TaxID=1333660 RepID=UPI00082449A8|nr:Ref family recombination enhancement nuclease [Endozoicomonas atrinae]